MSSDFQNRMRELDMQIEKSMERQAIAAKLAIFFYGLAAICFIISLIIGGLHK